MNSKCITNTLLMGLLMGQLKYWCTLQRLREDGLGDALLDDFAVSDL